MDKSAHDSSEEIQRLREDLDQLREDIKSLGGNLSRILDSTKESGRAKAQEEVDALFKELREAYDSVQDRGAKTRASLEREIEERPFTSVAGAFVIGLVLGKLFSSSR